MRTSEALQRALATALRVPSLVDTPFYDGPLAGVRPPYLTIGQEKLRWRGWKAGGTAEHLFVVALYAARQEHMAVKQRLGDVVAAVLGMPRRLGGVRFVTLNLLATQMKRGKRDWMEGTAEFRAISVEE